MSGLDLLDEHPMDVVFHKEICGGGYGIPPLPLETTLEHVERWLGEQKDKGYVWTFKIERQTGGAYLVTMHHQELGEHISHAHDLKRSLKMTTVLADRASRNRPQDKTTCYEPGCETVFVDASRQKIYCEEHACHSCGGTGVVGERESCQTCDMSGRKNKS